MALWSLTLALGGVATGGNSARAQSSPPLPSPPPPPSSTASLAGQIVRGLFPPGAQPDAAARTRLTFAVTPTFDAWAPGGGAEPPPRVTGASRGRMAAFLADAVEAALRAEGPIAGRVPPSDEADLRVELDLAVEPDRVTVAARLRRPPRTVWEALRAPHGALVRTAFAAAPLDMELRALLGLGPRPVRLDRLRLRWLARSTHPLVGEAPVLDLAVSDLDGDGRPEILALQARRVLVLRWARRGPRTLVAHAALDAPGLGAPASSAPLRQPMGRVVVVTRPDGTRVVVAASSERAAPVVLRLADGALARPPAPASVRGWPLYALGPDRLLTAPWPRGTDVLSGPVAVERLAGPAAGPSARAALGDAAVGGAYSVRSFPLWIEASPSWAPVTVVARPGGRLGLRRSRATPVAPARRAGDVAALADLDADGAPELLTTSDRVDGTDRLRLYTLSGTGRPRLVWGARLTAPVTAATFGAPVAGGRPVGLVAVAEASGRARLAALVPPARGASGRHASGRHASGRHASGRHASGRPPSNRPGR